MSGTEPVLSVTMTPAAAEHALAALRWAAARIDLPEHPGCPADVKAWEAEQWLHWLGGRILCAQGDAKS